MPLLILSKRAIIRIILRAATLLIVLSGPASAQQAPLSNVITSYTPQGAPAGSKPIMLVDPHVISIKKPDGTTIALGQSCKRRTDDKAGVFRRDACNRWYCGRTDRKDISEALPNIAEETGCAWRVDAANRCVCQKESLDKGKTP